MADAVKSSGPKLSDLRALALRGAGPFAPVIGSAMGVLWESAGLVCNVASLGIALMSETKQAAPKRAAARRPPALGASNVIRFPAQRGMQPTAIDRSSS